MGTLATIARQREPQRRSTRAASAATGTAQRRHRPGTTAGMPAYLLAAQRTAASGASAGGLATGVPGAAGPTAVGEPVEGSGAVLAAPPVESAATRPGAGPGEAAPAPGTSAAAEVAAATSATAEPTSEKATSLTAASLAAREEALSTTAGSRATPVSASSSAAVPPTAHPARSRRDTSAEAATSPAGTAAPPASQEAAAREASAAPAPDPRAAIAPAIGAIRHRAGRARRHRAAGVAVASAQRAAQRPAVEQTRGAAVRTVAQLDAADAEAVRRDAFKARLREAIAAATPQPKSEAEAERLMKHGGAEASGVLRGELASERDVAAGPLKSAAASQVLPSAIAAAPPTALEPEPLGAAPAPVSPAPAVPAALPPERLDPSSDRAPTEQLMAENDITPAQLERGQEPAFGPALEARTQAEEHEASLAPRYREHEAGVRERARGGARQLLTQGLEALHGTRAAHIAAVVGEQLGTLSRDATERQRVTNEITAIKDRTRADVEAILAEMERAATQRFEAGLAHAERAYEDTFEEAKGGIGTWLTTWGSRWERLIERSLAKARTEYLRQVDVAIDAVADLVEAQLARAKARVAEGRREVEDYVATLGDDLRRHGEEAAQAVGADFDALGEAIDARRDALIDRLAQQYKDSYERMAAMEERLREANKSLWQRVYDATVGLVKKILAFKDMLLGLLGKAAGVIRDILGDPIGFLRNLVAGVMQGLRNFIGRIATHLEKGLMDWLFGALGGAGLRLPERFDLQGIVGIVMQVLGLSWARLRARAVKLVGEPVVAALEKTAEVFRVVVTEGIPGLWRFVRDKLGELKTMVLDAIFDFVKERVIVAGITWIIGLLNPASAFFKACKAIYDIVVFFINRGRQLIALVNAVVDAIAAIAKGAIGTAVSLVEGALAKAVPLAIGFLAGLLGLGDPARPVRALIERARAPVERAIDWVIGLAVKGAKAVAGAVRGVFGKKGETREDRPEGDEGPAAARSAARKALDERLGAETTADEAATIARAVEAELRPMGVRRIVIGDENADGERPILVEASPLTRVKTLVARRVLVALSARVTVAKGDVLEGMLHRPQRIGGATFGESLTFRESYTRAKQREALFGGGEEDAARRGTAPLPAVSQPPGTAARKGHQPGAGVIIEPEAGSSELEILAWNTGNSIGRKDAAGEYQSNVSHAEHQFVEWFLGRPSAWRRRVTAVAVVVEAAGSVDRICHLCSADFDRIRSLHPDIALDVRFVGKAVAGAEKLRVEA